MRRRAFIVGLGGAAALPFAARAQQAMPVIGFLRSTSLADSTHLVVSFRRGLKDAGYTEGQNVTVEYRSADGYVDRVPALAADLIGRKVNIIVANSTAAHVVRAAAPTMPMVFLSGNDPVKDGLVTNLNRPGGSITGVMFFSDELGTKRLELLRQLVPKATTIGVLAYPNNPGTQAEQRQVQAAAQAMGQHVVVINVSGDRDIETSFTTLVQGGAGAVFVGSGAFLFGKRDQLVALAARHALPASYPLREFVMAGGLMSYGSSIADAYRQTGVYAGRILAGEKAGELPVVRSTKFEFVINLKTAKTLNLEISNALLATADEVIE